MIKVIDSINNISLSDFTLYSNNDLQEICAINENIKIEHNKVDNLEYITIPDFLKNPEELKKFLIDFPTEDRIRSIQESKYTDIVSQAPGFQQTFSSIFFKPISQKLHEVLMRHNMCQYEWNSNLWDFYTNCMYSGMKSYNKNYEPHVDEFSYAGNIYLSKIQNTSTSFFKYAGAERIYNTINEVAINIPERNRYNNLVRNRSITEKAFDEWQIFEGNEHFIKYFEIPSLYNCVSLYKGKYWHNVKFDASIPDRIRYSLVAVLK